MAPTSDLAHCPVTGQLRSLVDLPGEILDIIINECQRVPDISYYELTMDHYPSNNEWPPLKTLRVLNRALSYSFTPRLFETIVLYQNHDCWQNLENIALSPTLAACVKRIQIAHINLLGAYDLESWKSRTSRLREGGIGSFSDNPAAGGRFAKYDFSVDAGWARYQRWCDAESIMSSHEKNHTAPTISLDRLINLESIETVGFETLGNIHRKPCFRDDSGCGCGCLSKYWKPHPATRRCFETSIQMGFQGRDDQIGLKSRSGHLSTTLIALQNCGRPVRKLVFHRTLEFEHSMDSRIKLLFLKHLVLDTSKDSRNDHKINGISKWILHLPNLEHLTIRESIHLFDSPNLFEYLWKGVWPKLRRLELSHINASIDDLWRLIDKHIEKLEYLSILDPEHIAWLNEEGPWISFCEKVRRDSRWSAKAKILLTEDIWGQR